MDIFRTPGNNLMGNDKIQFDELKQHIDNATVDLLLRPDWEINIRVVDGVNACSSQSTINEIVFLIRKKFSASQPKTVYLALTLIEALVKNCGHRIYTAVNQDSFMKELGKVARKYHGKTGAENVEVASLALDIVQAWGEAFLPLQHRYPNIPRLYQDLRKERMPFSSQYDKNRVPILSNEELDPSTSSNSRRQSNASPAAFISGTAEDELVAAAMAASLADVSGSRGDTSYRSRSSSTNPPTRPKNDTVESVQTSRSILSEMILAANSVREIITNELAIEISTQLTLLLTSLAQQIETELMTNPEGLELLFKANDDGQMVATVFDKLKRGTLSLEQGKKMLQDSNNATATATTTTTSTQKENSLLDFDSPGNTPKATNVGNTPIEETMGLYSMPNVSTSGKGPTKSLPPPVPMRKPSTGPAPIISNTAPVMSSAVVDDPFGPSSSSIDALLSPPDNSPPPIPPKSTIDPFFISPPSAPATARGSSYDPFGPTSSAPLVPAPVQSVDPLDGLLAIATRSDDFDLLGPKPEVPSQPVAAPLKPPRSESSIPHQQYQNYPPPLIPSQAPYPGTVPYGGMPMQPSPAQPAGWPGSQPMPQSQGAPPMYWQVGGPTGQPMNQPYPPNAPGGYPLNMGGQQPSTGASGSANPFDLF